MKDVEKYETFEDLKKSENIESQTFDNGQEVAEEFIELLRAQNKQTLDNFRAGKFEDADVDVIKKVATELASKY